MTPDAIARLLSQRPRSTRTDGRPSAVLIALSRPGDELQVLLTRRSEGMRTHGGQFAFPGGASDPGDGSREETARREAFEEVGLRREHVTLLGSLDDTLTVSHFVVTPVVGWYASPYVFSPAESEVSLVVELPLREFIAGPEIHTVTVGGEARDVPGFRVGEHLVWGATARMLSDLVTALSPLL